MEDEVVENLSCIYSYLGNKKKMTLLASKLNVYVGDLKKDKNATAMDILDNILACYKKKYPDIDKREVGVSFGDPEMVLMTVRMKSMRIEGMVRMEISQDLKSIKIVRII